MRASSIAALVSARRNSKYLAKFMFGITEHTEDGAHMTVTVMLNEHDTWNLELARFFGRRGVAFLSENMRLGRAGLHEYFNLLLKTPPAFYADWIVYFCDDHFITMPAWDEYIRGYIDGRNRSGDSEGKSFPLDPNEVWVIVPKFDNCGAMNHVVSRGFVRAMGDRLANHGWVDSYINDLMRHFPDRVIRMDEEMFHDFTHDVPSPMHDGDLQSVVSEKGKALPAYNDPAVSLRLQTDAAKLLKVIQKESRLAKELGS